MRILSFGVFHLALFMSAFAHDQTRDVYEVYAVEYAVSNNRVPLKTVAVNATSTDSTAFSFFVWYLKGNNGRKVLVDTGFLEDSSKSRIPLKQYQRPDRALERIHVEPDDITDVIITHPHYDHIGGLELFSHATVWMQKNDFGYFVGGAWQKGANNLGLDKKDVLKAVQANLDGRLRLVDGDSVEIIPGIRVFIGSRHSYESQHVLVSTSGEKVLLASDDVWFYYNIEHMLSVPLTFDQDAYVRQLHRMKTLVSNPNLIIPGHDPGVLSRFEPVAKGVVRIR